MKKLFLVFIVCILALSSVLTASADNGKVTYSGNAGNFIFAPGSEHSLTDLFPNFKGVMPGDTLTQQITVKNDADDKVKVKIYIRSKGAHEDSVDFLSKLHLTVTKSEENEMAYMFDAAANETAQLTEWTYLGLLYSGGEVNLDVNLTVPVELDNQYQDQIGYLDWEFMVEEMPAEPDDPVKPGDDSNKLIYFTLMLGSVIFLIILLAWRKKDKEKKQNAAQF
jgi:hypothetical protein